MTGKSVVAQRPFAFRHISAVAMTLLLCVWPVQFEYSIEVEIAHGSFGELWQFFVGNYLVSVAILFSYAWAWKNTLQAKRLLLGLAVALAISTLVWRTMLWGDTSWIYAILLTMLSALLPKEARSSDPTEQSNLERTGPNAWTDQ